MNDTLLNADLNTLNSAVGLDVKTGYNFGTINGDPLSVDAGENYYLDDR